MTEPSDYWADLINQLVDGAEVDWDTQEINNPTDAELLAQLKTINEIQYVFASQKVRPVKADEKPLKILFKWGHLQVLEKLGEGGYGEVFRAFDPVLNREVALKLLKPDQLATFHSKLFIEEAQRIARVRNRHVLAIHGASVYDGRAGFWSDLIVGNTLVDQDPMQLSDLLQVAAAMSHALGAVHQAGLIHGDVKAANVMKDQNGQYVLMDFGAGLESGTEHASNHSVGSPLLMAPELFQEQPKSPASDQYALGCLLFKLASDRYPVQGKNILDIVAAHQQHNYIKLHTLRADLPKSLISLIQQLISPIPGSRPTAAEVSKKIDDIINEPARRKKRRLVFGIMGSLLLGLLLASTGLYFANKERQKAVLEQQKAQAVNEFLQEILGSSFNFGTGREVRVADMLELAATNSLDDFKNQPEILATLTSTLGLSFQNLQMMTQSQEQLLKSLALHQSLYGDEHPDTLQIKLFLAKAEEAMGNNQASWELCQSVIAHSENKPLLKNHRQAAQVLCATVKSNLTEFAKAEAILSQVIEQAEQEPKPPKHLYSALLAQGNNFFSMSNYEKTEETAQKAINISKKIDNFRPTNFMAATNQLAIALSAQGKYAEAEPILTEQLKQAEQFYGVNNTGYLQLLINLGANLQSQGKLAAAVDIQEQAVKLTETLKGGSDQMTISSQINLANTYVSLDRLVEGEQLMREVLKMSETVMGPDRIETFLLQYNLGELLNNTGRFNESLQLSQQSLPQMQTTLGDSHLITLLTQDNIAVSLNGTNQHQSAQVLLEKVLNEIKKLFGENSPYTALVWTHLIDTLYAGGNLLQAIDEQSRLLALLSKLNGEQHPATIEAQNKLNELQQEQR